MNKKDRKKYNKEYAHKIRKDIINHYSNGKNECACCNENIFEFLVIDHINGGGNSHRKNVSGRGGMNFYVFIRKENYPIGLQVLCHNCNMAKGYNKICPHKKL